MFGGLIKIIIKIIVFFLFVSHSFDSELCLGLMITPSLIVILN